MSRAAGSLAALIAQSATERIEVIETFQDAESCGPSLGEDAGMFRVVAASRQELIKKLNALAGRRTLPGEIIRDLAQAWQASSKADVGYAAWAHDNLANTCAPGDLSDRAFRATLVLNFEAMKKKRAFAALWDPIAAKYHLATYQATQL